VKKTSLALLTSLVGFAVNVVFAADVAVPPRSAVAPIVAPAPLVLPRLDAGLTNLLENVPEALSLEDSARLSEDRVLGPQTFADPAAGPEAARRAADAATSGPAVGASPRFSDEQGGRAANPADQPVRADSEVRGKTLLIVGTRSSRPFIIEEAMRVANALGLNVILLDKAESRVNSYDLVPDENFVAAPIDKRSDESVKKIVDKVKEMQLTRRIDYVTTFRSHHAKLVGKIVDATGIQGMTGAAAGTAEDKVRMRKALNKIPDLFVPFKEVRSADEARQTFREYGGKFVMKSKLGENSRFVELGIDSEEKMAEAFTKMDAALRAEAKSKAGSDTIFNTYPGIMVERMLEPASGTREAAVNLVMQNGKAKFALVNDTIGIGEQGELAGGSSIYPSQMKPNVTADLARAAARAAEAVGIRDGNALVDLIMTPEGPRIIEVNPFLAGAAIFKAVKLVTGMSLIELGLRAMLGLQIPDMGAPQMVVDYRFAASENTGRIQSIEGEIEAKLTPGVRHVQLLADPGDEVKEPIENGFEEWAEVMGTGPTLADAVRASVTALSKLKAKVLAEQAGDYLQQWAFNLLTAMRPSGGPSSDREPASDDPDGAAGAPRDPGNSR
jgi:hypothetical protein